MSSCDMIHREKLGRTMRNRGVPAAGEPSICPSVHAFMHETERRVRSYLIVEESARKPVAGVTVGVPRCAGSAVSQGEGGGGKEYSA